VSITYDDPQGTRPVTYYLLVEEDLKKHGVTHATLQPGAENVIWVSKGPSHCPINLYYVFSEGQIIDVQVD